MSISDLSRLWRNHDMEGLLKSSEQQAIDYAEYMRSAQANQAAQAQASHHMDAQGYQYPQPHKPPEPNIHVRALRLLKARLAGLDSTYNIASDEVILTHVHQDKVYVFFVLKGRAGHFEDEAALFPSDGLITKIRIIR
jgi:hypothetical protein